MRRERIRRRILVWAAVALVLQTALGTGCARAGGTAGRGVAPASPESTSAAGAAKEVRVVANLQYMTARDGDTPALVDVYAPAAGGPFPLVVMLHGAGLSKEWLAGWATAAAERGAVVFVPDWLRGFQSPRGLTAAQMRDAQAKQIGDVAAAIRFARGVADQYGGDPGQLTLFGHSCGAVTASMEAFGAAPAAPGGLEGAGSTVPESLVLFDGDHLLANEGWDPLLAEDAGLTQLLTPWQWADQRFAFPVTFIGSGDAFMNRAVTDPWASDSWLQVRDPSGSIRRGLEGVGGLAGGTFENADALELLAQRLRASGSTAEHLELAASTHIDLGAQDMQTLLDALVPQ